MEILEKLAPAETHLIRANKDSTYKELLKLTLADLCLKKVLRIEEKRIQSHPRNPIRVLKYVTAGKNLPRYQHKLHEFPFLSPFLKNLEIEILFNQFVKLVYENGDGIKSYVHDALLQNVGMRKYFKTDFFRMMLGKIILTTDGEYARTKIDQAIQQLETELPNIMHADKRKALAILKRIGGNVFLIRGLEFELLKEIDKELSKELERNDKGYSAGCSGCFTFYGDHSDSFDGAFDSAGSAGGGSGCSADSGCSGCSGCGGCGGCS